MGIICETKNPKEELKGTKTLYFSCPNLVSIPVIPGLKDLNCRDCPNLTSIAIIPGLTDLNCSDCPNLTILPIIPSLVFLNCTRCINLREIPIIPSLKEIICGDCISLKEIPIIPSLVLEQGSGLKRLYCYGCTKLTSVPNVKTIWYSGCPWISRNPDYPKNIRKLRVLQMFIKNNLKYWRFKRWIKSKCFTEWFYHPDNFGGYKHKQSLFNELQIK